MLTIRKNFIILSNPMADSNNLPAKRRQTLNSKLTSEDNVYHDAVKQCQALQSKTKTFSTASHQASVEAVDDPENHALHNAGRPKNTNSILEATGDELDEFNLGYQHALKRRKTSHLHTEVSGTASRSSRQASVEAVDDPEDHALHKAGRPKNPNSILEATDDELEDEEEGLQEETDEQVLGKFTIHTLIDTGSSLSSLSPEGLAVSYLRILST